MKCEKHPDRDASLIGVSRRMCLECQLAYQLGYRERAYGTGIGKEAHAEAQESGRYDKIFNMKERTYL